MDVGRPIAIEGDTPRLSRLSLLVRRSLSWLSVAFLFPTLPVACTRSIPSHLAQLLQLSRTSLVAGVDIDAQSIAIEIRAGSNSRTPSAHVWCSREADEHFGWLQESSEQNPRDSRWDRLQNRIEAAILLGARHNHNVQSRIPQLLELYCQDGGLENQMDCPPRQEAIP